MAPRTHATAVGSIACDELDELGAGTREGWLSDPAILAALHPHAIAISRARTPRPLVLLLGWQLSSPVSPVNIRPSLSPDDGELTAIEWLAVGDLLALALATSAGCLLIYSPQGDLIHKQVVHSGCVLRLRFREIKCNSSQNLASEELCVVMPGVIARFDGSDIQSLLQRWFQEENSRFWDRNILKKEPEGDSFGRIPFQLWNVSKYGSCADGVITGLMSPPLLELQLLLLLDSRVNVTTVQLLLEMML